VTYEIGSGTLLDGIDDAVTGLEAGASATFTTELKGGSQAGQDAEVTVKVTAVQEKELPELDDEFAQLASEFDTLDELREDSRTRLARMKEFDQATQAQEKVLDALLELVDMPYPEKLLQDEIETRRHNLEHHQLEPAGLDLETYLKTQDKTVEEFEAELDEQAKKGIKTQFVLDAIASKEELSVSQDELTEHLLRRAAGSGMTPDQFAQQVVQAGQVPVLVGEVVRGKALALVVEAAKVVDSNGEPVDFEEEDEEEAAAETAATETSEADVAAQDEARAEAAESAAESTEG
jgi:trigger factor